MVDTNLLLMFLVGLHDPSYITVFKRTSEYEAADFRIVQRLLQRFRRLVTTPHILGDYINVAF